MIVLVYNVMPVTRTRKYGGKCKDALVVAHLNLTGSSNNDTFNTRHATAYISINFRPSVPTELTVGSLNQHKPVWSSLVCMTNRNSMACCVTSDLDFNKGGCVIQI